MLLADVNVCLSEIALCGQGPVWNAAPTFEGLLGKGAVRLGRGFPSPSGLGRLGGGRGRAHTVSTRVVFANAAHQAGDSRAGRGLGWTQAGCVNQRDGCLF